MPTPPKKRPDRHYNFTTTNKVFAWSSLALLATSAWMVIDDYKKPWKRYQSEFRDRERAVIEAQAEEQRAALNAEEIAGVEAEIAREAEGLTQRAGEIDALEGTIGDLADKVYEADATYRQTKSLLDTAKYELDVAIQHGSGEEARRAEYEQKVVELRENQIALETYRDEFEAAEDELDEMEKGRTEAEQRLATLRVSLTSLQDRAATLEKGIDFLLLNFPLMDMLAPDIKVEQVMLSGLYHDINFTDIDRVDRCVTCHVAANRGGFDGEEWEAPFRSHPRLDLFVGDTSPHPYATFGCTTCHEGLDRATDFARLEAEGLRHLRAYPRATFEVVIGPPVGLAVMAGLDRDDERVWFVDDGIATQKVRLRSETNGLLHATQARQGDAELDVTRRYWLPVAVCPGPVLGRDPGLEYGKLQREAAAGQIAAAVGTTGNFLMLVRVRFLVMTMTRRAPASCNGGQQEQSTERSQRKQRRHRTAPPVSTAPVSLSISMACLCALMAVSTCARRASNTSFCTCCS